MNTGAATSAPRMHWGLLLAASATLMITMGARQTTGLFVSPIHQDTGIGIAAIRPGFEIGWAIFRCLRGSGGKGTEDEKNGQNQRQTSHTGRDYV